MAITLDKVDEDLKVDDEDIEYLYKNYDKLVEQHNEEYVAIKNKQVVIHEKDLDRFNEKLKEKGYDVTDTLIRFIRDKRNEIH